MKEATSCEKKNRGRFVVFGLLVLPWLLLSLFSLMLRSNEPEFISRYSWAFALFHASNFFVLAILSLVLARKPSHYLVPLLIFLLMILSLSLGGNNQFISNTYLVYSVLVARIGFALALIMWSYFSSQLDRGTTWINRALILGGILFSILLLDLALFAYFDIHKNITAHFQFRNPNALNSIESIDVVVIGDSMVWGQTCFVRKNALDVTPGKASTRWNTGAKC